MPTYEYACENCGHKFEQFQTITSKPLRTCPKCGKQKLNRLIGAGAGIIFKGSGFYQTDYRSESYRKASANDKKTTSTEAAPKKTETKDTSKTEKTSSKTKEKSQ